MYNVMGALCGCRAVKLDSCNNLLSSFHTILVIILRYVRLNMTTKILLLPVLLLLFLIFLLKIGWNILHDHLVNPGGLVIIIGGLVIIIININNIIIIIIIIIIINY